MKSGFFVDACFFTPSHRERQVPRPSTCRCAPARSMTSRSRFAGSAARTLRAVRRSRISASSRRPRTSGRARECQKVWGSAGFVRRYGHMIHRRPTDTAVAIGCLYRDRREGYRHGGRKAVRKRQQRPPRAVDRAGHPRPRHALPDCPTLFGTLRGQNNATGRARSCTGALPPLMHGSSCIISIP